MRQFVRRRLHEATDLVDFALSLINGVLSNRGDLDARLQAHAANWSLDRMAVTDRNVLRLGAYEIVHTQTPGPVVINEAVELAKRFGSQQSSQFVNGILDPFLQEKPSGGRAAANGAGELRQADD